MSAPACLLLRIGFGATLSWLNRSDSEDLKHVQSFVAFATDSTALCGFLISSEKAEITDSFVGAAVGQKRDCGDMR